jgi:urease accessory protein
MKAKQMTLAAALATTALAGAAQAHGGHGSESGFASGFAHPLGGWDHLLAMVAVGVWASQLKGRALWALPAAFVAAMSVGGLMGMNGAGLPLVEVSILASVLVLGLLITSGARASVAGGALLVAAFALFHGHAHGAEMPASVQGAEYLLGFASATALLHATGIALGSALLSTLREPSLRFTGAAIAVAGVVLAAF